MVVASCKVFVCPQLNSHHMLGFNCDRRVLVEVQRQLWTSGDIVRTATSVGDMEEKDMIMTRYIRYRA